MKEITFLGEDKLTLVTACTCVNYAHSTNHRFPTSVIKIKELIMNTNFGSVTRNDFNDIVSARLDPIECDGSYYDGDDYTIDEGEGINRLNCTHGDMIKELFVRYGNFDFMVSAKKKRKKSINAISSFGGLRFN